MASDSHDGTLAEALADRLAAIGARAFFGLMGEDTAALTTHLSHRGVAYYGTRHESTAVSMADGYAWAGGGLGVAMVTRGPGLTNAISAARTAVRRGNRVLIVTGDRATTGGYDRRTVEVKHVDQQALAAAVGLAFARPHDAAGVGPALDAALDAADAGRPALLSIPVDLLRAPGTLAAHVPAVADAEPPRPLEPSGEVLERIVALLAAHRRPLVLVGRGALAPATRTLVVELAERTGALIGTTLMAKDAFRGHRLNLGVVGGYANEAGAQLLGEVDLVLVLGASLTPFTTAQRTLFAQADVVHVDADRTRIGENFPVSLGVVADAGATVRALLRELPSAPAGERPFHAPEVIEQLARLGYSGSDEGSADELDARVAASVLDAVLPPERIVIMDGGRAMTAVGRYVRADGPDAFRLAIDFGQIGASLGIALGAAVARPARPTVLFIGDGAMSMVLGDLLTLSRYALPVTIVVLNDNAYGAERIVLDADGLPNDCASFPDTDFAALAAAAGVPSRTVRTVDELREAAGRVGAGAGPLLLDCRVRADITYRPLSWEGREVRA